MKKLIFLCCSIFVASNLYASAGEKLYKTANCTDCHGAQKYDPMNEKVKNLHDLNGWVSRCATNLNTGWFPQEENKVVEYLNETHYKF